jgi:hypothetical protein
LWRQIATPGVPGLTRRIFFYRLLDRHPAIISDDPQTTRGRDFWISRLRRGDEFRFANRDHPALSRSATLSIWASVQAFVCSSRIFPIHPVHEKTPWGFKRRGGKRSGVACLPSHSIDLRLNASSAKRATNASTACLLPPWIGPVGPNYRPTPTRPGEIPPTRKLVNRQNKDAELC